MYRSRLPDLVTVCGFSHLSARNLVEPLQIRVRDLVGSGPGVEAKLPE
jgi:hypothetical protein